MEPSADKNQPTRISLGLKQLIIGLATILGTAVVILFVIRYLFL